ncbi:MAG: hypothetical protein AAF203_05390, partial [Pseudomonadota bacterium]
LLEFETIDGEDVNLIVKGGSVDDVRHRHSEREKAMAEEQKLAKEEMDKRAKEEEKEAADKISGAVGDPVTS